MEKHRSSKARPLAYKAATHLEHSSCSTSWMKPDFLITSVTARLFSSKVPLAPKLFSALLDGDHASSSLLARNRSLLGIRLALLKSSEVTQNAMLTGPPVDLDRPPLFHPCQVFLRPTNPFLHQCPFQLLVPPRGVLEDRPLSPAQFHLQFHFQLLAPRPE
jgi:hypothetical protein